MKIGIIGGGQLGQMLAMAAIPLGFEAICLEKSKDCPAGQVCNIFEADYGDHNKIAAFASKVDVITYEFENVPVESLSTIQAKLPIYPPIAALEVSQERVKEKIFFNDCGVPTAKFAAIDNKQALTDAIQTIGLPGILKTCRFGYDGKGQFPICQAADTEQAWHTLGNKPLIYEQKIPFEREVSMLGARGAGGEIVFYPLVENQHSKGILTLSKAPYQDEQLTQQAQGYVGNILQRLDYVGVIAVEFFVKEGRLLANEMAPRVHNSGHWTIEGTECSQFENHIRSICGLPLGSTQTVGSSAMINIIGDLPDMAAILKVRGAHLHLYGKTPRPHRKLGHITLTAPYKNSLEAMINKLSFSLYRG